MSLDTDIGNMIASAQALIQMFEMKKSEIESAVAAAVSAIPKLNKKFYVDAVTGDDSNDGSNGSPMQNIAKAINSVPSGGYGFLILTPGQTHLLTDSIDLTNKTIYAYGVDSVNRPTIENSCPSSNSTVGFYGTNGTFKSLIVNYKTATLFDPASSKLVNNGIFNVVPSNSSLNVAIYSSVFDIGDTCVFSQYAGCQLSISLHHVEMIETAVNDQGFLLDNRHDVVTRLSAGSIILPQSKAWSDIIKNIIRAADNEPKNILTHLTI